MDAPGPRLRPATRAFPGSRSSLTREQPWSLSSQKSQASFGGKVRSTSKRAEIPTAKAGTRVDERNPVVVFLREIGLHQYAGALLQIGFDDMETLLEIEDDDMKELGIPVCHALKLRTRLQEMHRRNAGPNQLNESNPVVAFLIKVGLSQYADALLRIGFDDMETLCEIEDADLRDLGVPRGHVLKMRRHLLEYQHGEDTQACPFQRPAQYVHAAAACPVRGHGQPGKAAAAASPCPLPTEQMKTDVERSWEQVQALGSDVVGELLYKNLFAIAPDTIELFPLEVRCKYSEWTADEGDEADIYESPALRKLFSKFVNAVGHAVAGLQEPVRMVPMLTRLGARHINYGVCEGHWQLLGDALNCTLRTCLGEAFTLEVEHAWTTVYGFVSAVMIEGLRGAIAARDAGLRDNVSVSSGAATTRLPSVSDACESTEWGQTRSGSSEANYQIPDTVSEVVLDLKQSPFVQEEDECWSDSQSCQSADGTGSVEADELWDAPSARAAAEAPVLGPPPSTAEAPTLLQRLQLTSELSLRDAKVLLGST
mmetsp:Transcript_11702/g.36530  ORF Transcript_11702/g.36530 Transcript_11702/m.36530 type:complete len:540 (-) Transcript_11702:401-2020(-)